MISSESVFFNLESSEKKKMISKLFFLNVKDLSKINYLVIVRRLMKGDEVANNIVFLIQSENHSTLSNIKMLMGETLRIKNCF